MLKVLSSNGYTFSLSIKDKYPWGDLRLKFEFELNWLTGSIQTICSGNRFKKFEEIIGKLNMSEECSHHFINEDGNLEIKISTLPTGLYFFEIVAIPSMSDDDGVEFSLEGHVVK